MQRPTQLPVDAELDVGVQAVPDHAGPGAVELELALDGVHHGLAGLAELEGLLAGGGGEWGDDGAGAEEEVVVHGQGGVAVGGEEEGAAAEIVQAVGDLEVVEVEVEAGEDDADLGVEQGAVGEAAEVVGRHVPAVALIGAAQEPDPFGLELLLDAALTDDEDLVLARGGLEDAGYVDGGGVGGAEDVLDLGGDTEVGELLEVLGAGFGAVVGYEDGSLAWDEVSTASLSVPLCLSLCADICACALSSLGDWLNEPRRRMFSPLDRRRAMVSGIPSKMWSPDQRTPIHMSPNSWIFFFKKGSSRRRTITVEKKDLAGTC